MKIIKWILCKLELIKSERKRREKNNEREKTVERRCGIYSLLHHFLKKWCIAIYLVVSPFSKGSIGSFFSLILQNFELNFCKTHLRGHNRLPVKFQNNSKNTNGKTRNILFCMYQNDALFPSPVAAHFELNLFLFRALDAISVCSICTRTRIYDCRTCAPFSFAWKQWMRECGPHIYCSSVFVICTQIFPRSIGCVEQQPADRNRKNIKQYCMWRAINFFGNDFFSFWAYAVVEQTIRFFCDIIFILF